jgi:hypothetical protein
LRGGAANRIDALFEIERGITGVAAAERLLIRKEQSALLQATLDAWLVEEWATRRRRAEKIDVETFPRSDRPERVAPIMTVRGDTLSKAERITVAAIEAGGPTLVEARGIIAEFHLMSGAGLPPSCHRASLVASVRGVTNDEAAVRAAITLPWSN